MTPPTISDAAKLTRQCGARGVLVLAFDERGAFAGASYGMTRPECRDLGALLDAIGVRLEVGEIPVWSKP